MDTIRCQAKQNDTNCPLEEKRLVDSLMQMVRSYQESVDSKSGQGMRSVGGHDAEVVEELDWDRAVKAQRGDTGFYT